MSSVQLTKDLPGKSSHELYAAVLKALPQAGFEIWKTRELAGLIMSQGSLQGCEVKCNIMVSMWGGSITATFESEGLDEASLSSSAEQILDELIKNLS